MMINVIATMKLNPGCRQAFIEVLKGIIGPIRAEEGCIEYLPAVDLETGISTQSHEEDRVVIIEKWASLDAFHGHRAVPHLLEFKESTKDMVAGMSIMVLNEIK